MDIRINGLPKELMICNRVYTSREYRPDIWIRPVKANASPTIQVFREINTHDQIVIKVYFDSKEHKNYYVSTRRLKEKGFGFVLNELISTNI